MKILCIHQGYELYGSDRSFIQSIEALRQKWPHAHITAYIPRIGPIYDSLQKAATEVMVEDLWVPRKNALLRLFTVDALRFPASVMHAIRQMRQYDMVYINTLTVLNYNIAARFAAIPSIIHVREIVGKKAAMVFSAVLRFSRAAIIYNSNATANAFRLHPLQLSRVIYNGVPDNREIPPPLTDGRIKLLMLGRFNSWKGQDLLVEAVAQLPKHEQQQLDIRLVGGVFENQHHFIDTVKQAISKHGLQDIIRIEPFSNDTDALYAWADLVAVPSKKPEPFGRVATEAMSYSRPVIAADHGGLSEIVENDETGWLFQPNNPESFACILSWLIANKPEIPRAGHKARQRFLSHFSQSQYDDAIVSLCEYKGGVAA
jgi:glycosyltransferase involved in cell wall biosynthesis